MTLHRKQWNVVEVVKLQDPVTLWLEVTVYVKSRLTCLDIPLLMCRTCICINQHTMNL
jgi:hypothetical protein